MNDPSNKKIGLIPNNEFEKKGLDLGEAGQPNMDGGGMDAVSGPEIEAKNQELINANSAQVDKLHSMAVAAGLLREHQFDNFTLPNRNDKAHVLKIKLKEVNQKIDAVSGNETTEDLIALQDEKAALVTELLYSITTLITKELPQFIQRITDKFRLAAKSKNFNEVSKDLQQIQIIAPQWEALVTNSRETMKLLRRKHPLAVSDAYLGELNNSIYLWLNLNTANLQIEDGRSDGGTLLDVMEETKVHLLRLSDVDQTKTKSGEAGVAEISGEEAVGDATQDETLAIPIVKEPSERVEEADAEPVVAESKEVVAENPDPNL